MKSYVAIILILIVFLIPFLAMNSDKKTGSAIANIGCGEYSLSAPVFATADSEYSAAYTALKSIDGDTGTMWIGGHNTKFPHWISLDLGEIKCINSIQAYFYPDYAPLTVAIEISDDGQKWSKAVPEWKIGKGGIFARKDFQAKARFVRIFEIKGVDGTYGSLSEVKISNADAITENNAGLMHITILDADTEKLVKNAEVRIYDDSLTEIEVKTGNGKVTFQNYPILFEEGILALYRENGEKAPKINRFDSREYFADVAAPGYEPKLISWYFTEGKDSEATVYLSKDTTGFGITGYAVALKELIPSSEANSGDAFSDSNFNVPLKLAPQFPQSGKCAFRFEKLSASPVPEDFGRFNVKGILRTTKHCSGIYDLSLSLSDVQVVRVTGVGSVPFIFEGIVRVHGNAAGGLDCPSLTVQEILDEDHWIFGTEVSVGFRLPVLACNDPTLCPIGGGDGESEPVSACQSYLKGECAAQLNGALCDWEEPFCSGPLNGGSPAGGGADQLKQKILQEDGQRCCFCGYDTKIDAGFYSETDGKGEGIANVTQKWCNEFFSGGLGLKQRDPSFRCDVKEVIPILEWESNIKELSEKYSCKDPIAFTVVSHGHYDPDLRTEPDEDRDFTLTCSTFTDITEICLQNFPGRSIFYGGESCQAFSSEEGIDRHLSWLQPYLVS
ncbi:discoidin domain-containing protein [Candidatus Woesearchaeota archaeon]|nr:discoidin domain-containing protein [Candidatus Woesearchaeota archaeon]